jgi:hypothetical protein
MTDMFGRFWSKRLREKVSDARGYATIKLWTNHPRCFPIHSITEIDPTKSFWWTYDDPGFRYREVLPVLWGKLKTKHFLCGVWDKIVRGKSDDWTALFVTEIAEPLPKHIGALVSVPLPIKAASCLGPSPPIKIYDKNGKLRQF